MPYHGRKKASLLLGLLLFAVAVALTVISLQDDGSAPGSALDEPPTATPTADAGESSEIFSGPPVTSSGDSSGERSSGRARCVLENAGTMSCPSGFAVGGSADGLYPGKTVHLPLTIENPYEEDLQVKAIDVSVTATSESSCSTSNLQATDYTGPGFVVGGKDSGSIALSLTMSRAAPDACQGVTFTLAFTGEAEQA